ncbi:biotin--[acetyl-CoA-carboxylase] ligase [Catenulispora pinisilvae]|uniref:biotin--[acetyl-CoA-carboxylase] ligase n=1 Tax=Catenulispora pinisilvae TaxID=2705253 RepID=UPI0018927A69|nr:biotin--[acetyl-CoA-carboxylase] ligase [Catenulispora pinisilvae]
MTSDSPYSDLDRPPLRELALSKAVGRPGGLWRRIEVVAETASTNGDVADAARAGAQEGYVRVAEVQSAGRGRLGRTWSAPPRSGLFLSVLLRPSDVPAARWGWLPLLVGTAARTAVDAVSGVPVKLKWPNDLIVVDDTPSDAPSDAPGTEAAAGGSDPAADAYGAARKLGGILVERVDTAQGPAAVVGLGLNVSLRRDELPAPHATSLVLEGAKAADRDPLLRALLRELERWYTDWSVTGGDPMASGLLSAYAASCATIGRRVRVELPAGEPVVGEAVGLDGDGRLLVRTAAGERAFGAGDVVHLR